MMNNTLKETNDSAWDRSFFAFALRGSGCEARSVWALRKSEPANERLDVYARPHPGPVTRSLPLAQPSAGLWLRQIPFAASQAAQVPRGEGETLSDAWIYERFSTQSSAMSSLASRRKHPITIFPSRMVGTRSAAGRRPTALGTRALPKTCRRHFFHA